jgi:hypothetical protein
MIPFIHPLLLGGLAAVGLPILLHLLMRQKPKHVLFPAFRFLQQRAKTNQRKIRLRHLILLLMRMALIALICLALARPRLFSSRVGLSQNQIVAAVILIDTTPSMEYAVAGKSRLEEARQRALELLDDMNDSSRVAVIDTGEPGREWGSVAQARDKIRAMTIRPGGVPVSSSIAAAYQLLADVQNEQSGPDAEAIPKLLYVLSDRTVASWDAGRVPDLQGQRDRLPAPGVTGIYLDVGVDKPVDVAITQVEVKPQSFPANREAVIKATVTATGQGCNTDVLCKLSGQAVAESKPLKLEAGQSEVIEFINKPLKPGLYQAEITLATPDALPANNVRFVTFEVRGPREVLIVTDEIEFAGFFEPALRFKKDFVCKVRMPSDVQSLDQLKPYLAVCMLSVRLPDELLWELLDAYVNQGGNLLVVPGREETNPDNYKTKTPNNLLPGKLDKDVRVAGLGAKWEPLNRKHPFLAKFAGWKDQEIGFLRSDRHANRYWKVDSVPKENVIVNYEGDEKHPAILERLAGRPKGSGRVLMVTTPLDLRQPDSEEWNDYFKTTNADGFYVVFPNELVAYMVGDLEETSFNFVSGQVVTVPLPQLARFPEYALDGPGIAGSETRILRGEDDNELAIRQTNVTGNYTVSGGTSPWKSRYSLNPPPGEFQLDRVAVEEIEKLLGPDCVIAPGQNKPLSDALSNRTRQPLELFPWLMLLFVGLIVAESVMANRFYKPEPQGQESGVRSQ